MKRIAACFFFISSPQGFHANPACSGWNAVWLKYKQAAAFGQRVLYNREEKVYLQCVSLLLPDYFFSRHGTLSCFCMGEKGWEKYTRVLVLFTSFRDFFSVANWDDKTVRKVDLIDVTLDSRRTDLEILTGVRCSQPFFCRNLCLFVFFFNSRATGRNMCMCHCMSACALYAGKRTDEERMKKYMSTVYPVLILCT